MLFLFGQLGGEGISLGLHRLICLLAWVVFVQGFFVEAHDSLPLFCRVKPDFFKAALHRTIDMSSASP